ncbi:MAG: glycoside hydrolase family 95 protein, partial [Bacteroidales bacterium]|nr:glycoside hydrolase family 95 protein [Bacteroidales bacterium]
MNKIFLSIIAFVLLLISCKSPDTNKFNLKLRYNQPATIWDESLPVGNGRMGAMVFGGVYNERIQVNEESLWAGEHFNTNNPNALRDLPHIRDLIFEGKIQEAYELGNKSLLGTPPRFRSYQTLGDIYLSFDSTASFTNYKRELHLNPGISRSVFTIDEITYTREIFASAPDNIIVIQLSADKPGAINTTIALQRQKDATVKAENNQLILTGQIVDESSDEKGPGGKHMKFAAKLMAMNKGGEISADNSILQVKNADELYILFTAATDYNLEKLNFDRSIDPLSICNDILDEAEGKPYSQIRESHIKDHELIFNRVQFSLGGEQLSSIPTDIRLDLVKNGGDDPALIALYFQYGRYLLMGSSRAPGILPANLQGIWNGHFQAPWNSDYHTNINLQMNYWHVEICNLPETVDPLINIVDKWRGPGRITAK